MRFSVIVLTIVLSIFLWRMWRQARRSIVTRRRAIFDDCLDLFTDINITQDDVNYPILKARHKGLKVTIEPLIDHMAVRKIPALWLIITIESHVKYSGILDYLVRPHNHEFYSPSSKLETRLDIPPEWPQQQAILKTDYVEDIPPMRIVGQFVQHQFEDKNSKELLITPKGVRIVYLLDQATRSHYMVLRQMLFENDRIEHQLAERLLMALHKLLKDLSEPLNEAQV